MSPSPTYQDLYSLLLSIGFQEGVGVRASFQQRVFLHLETDTVLAFGRLGDEAITPADLLSTEVHLQANGIADQSIDSMLASNKLAARGEPTVSSDWSRVVGRFSPIASRSEASPRVLCRLRRFRTDANRMVKSKARQNSVRRKLSSTVLSISRHSDSQRGRIGYHRRKDTYTLQR